MSEQVTLAEQQGETQISTTDPDTRYLAKRNSSEVGINVVATAEASNKIIVNFDVQNQSDRYALGKSALEAKEILGLNAQNNASQAIYKDTNSNEDDIAKEAWFQEKPKHGGRGVSALKGGSEKLFLALNQFIKKQDE